MLTSIANPQASEWDKMNSLKHLEMLRETKKHTLIEKVLKESISFKQTLDVHMGQPHMVSFLVSNPFPEDELFTILIQGDDAGELHLVHNEGPNQEWQFWYQQGKCNKPINGWDSVSSKGDVLLRSGQ